MLSIRSRTASSPASIRRAFAAEWKRDGIRVQLGANGGERAALLALRRRHLLGAFPTSSTAFATSRRRSMASCWSSAHGAVAALQRPAAAPQPQDRHAQAHARATRPTSALYDILFDARRGPARAALRRAPARGSSTGRAARTAARSTCRRSLPSRAATSSRRCVPAPATPASRA